jgi:hypothetical protein
MARGLALLSGAFGARLSRLTAAERAALKALLEKMIWQTTARGRARKKDASAVDLAPARSSCGHGGQPRRPRPAHSLAGRAR